MTTITDPADLAPIIKHLRALGECAFDTETTGVQPFEGDRICSFSLYHPEVGAYFVPVRQQGLGVENIPESAMELLSEIQGKGHLVAGQNLSHDINFLRVEGLWDDDTDVFDTMYAAFLYDDSLPSFRLKGKDSISETILGDKEAANELDRLKMWRDKHPRATYDFCPIEILAPYAEQDVILAWRLKQKLTADLLGRGEPYDVLLPQEMKWVKIVTGLSATGLLFDFDRCGEIEKSHTQRLLALQETFNKEMWPGFNPNSAKAVMAYLNQNDINAPNTEVGTLWLYTKQLPLVKLIIEARQLGKVLSILRPWKKQAHKGGGRVYASWGATGHGYGDDYGQARTGRLRARKPALMAVSVYNRDGLMIHREKEVFHAPEGWVYGAIDVSQVEIRFAAHYSQEEAILEVLRDPDGDIHGTVATDLGMPRTRAKRVVFGGGLYGAGDKTMAQTMTDELHELVTPSQAGQWLRAFQFKYPRFKITHKAVERVARSRGALRLWNDRMMYIHPERDDPHKAWDWLIQGGVAAFMKEWMDRINEYLRVHGMRSRMVLQIHDEVIWEMPKEEQDALPALAALVEGIGPEGGWRCPIFHKIKVGERWSDL